MTSKRVSAPFDLMAELNDEPPDLKKQTTTVTAPAQTAPPSKAKTTVQPPSAPQKTIPTADGAAVSHARDMAGQVYSFCRDRRAAQHGRLN
jgi:hypothetical protein